MCSKESQTGALQGWEPVPPEVKMDRESLMKNFGGGNSDSHALVVLKKILTINGQSYVRCNGT